MSIFKKKFSRSQLLMTLVLSVIFSSMTASVAMSLKSKKDTEPTSKTTPTEKTSSPKDSQQSKSEDKAPTTSDVENKDQEGQEPYKKELRDNKETNIERDGFSNIVENAISSVVYVSSTQVAEERSGDALRIPEGVPSIEKFFQEFLDQLERPRKTQSVGSGFIINISGGYIYIVTNYHVIAGAKKLTVSFHNNIDSESTLHKTELDATMHAYDERTDLAVLKIKLDALPENRRNLKPLEWGDSNKSKVGDWVLAIGNPFGLGSTVTRGIISNRARNISGRSRSQVSEFVDDFIQTDAPLNMGNSGGCLFNMNGKIIGVTTAIFSPSGGSVGIGFAIPSSVAKPTVEQLIKFGHVKRGWLGVRIQAVTDDIAESLPNFGKARGAIMGSIVKDGPADKAGFKPGDVILEFDGKELGQEARLARVVGETAIGKPIGVKVWRRQKDKNKGEELTLKVVLEEYKQEKKEGHGPGEEKATPTEAKGVESLGLTLVPLTPAARQELRIPEDIKSGIGITKVSPRSEASIDKGLRRGDVVVEVNQQEVSKPEEFTKAVEKAKKDDHPSILLLVNRDNQLRYTTLKIKEKKKEDDDKDKDKDKDKNDDDSEKTDE